jgi:hypothetical protein
MLKKQQIKQDSLEFWGASESFLETKVLIIILRDNIAKTFQLIFYVYT